MAIAADEKNRTKRRIAPGNSRCLRQIGSPRYPETVACQQPAGLVSDGQLASQLMEGTILPKRIMGENGIAQDKFSRRSDAYRDARTQMRAGKQNDWIWHVLHESIIPDIDLDPMTSVSIRHRVNNGRGL